MKKMMMALCVVIVFSGAFIVYGSGSVNEKEIFTVISVRVSEATGLHLDIL